MDEQSRRLSSESTPRARYGRDERHQKFSPQDDDVVSDFGGISVGARVSRYESNLDDFIPISSPGHGNKMRAREENMYEELQREEREAIIGSLAVEGMVAMYELNEKKYSPPRSSLTQRGSPIKKLTVPSGLDGIIYPLSPKPIRSARQSLPCRMTPYRNSYSNPVSNPPLNLSPSTPSPNRRRRIPFQSINPDDTALYGAVPNTVEKVQLDVQKLLKENQKLKAKMGFIQCSVSIEKQLLNYELKGVRAKLHLSEKELEESRIESKMNDIIMQDHLDNSIKDIVGVILAEKEELTQKLRDARKEISTMEMRYNDRLETVINEKERIRTEYKSRNDDCIMLTADVLNLQAQRDCMKSSTVMTDFRTRSATKTQAKELTKIREAERRSKEQLIDFIIDFDKTADPSANLDDVIESFLSGRGLAINRNRRKHFAALKADNNRLYDDLDTMQELLEVEAALQFTRVELYTKSVHRASAGSANNTPTKSSVNMLLNTASPFRENGKKINGRWSLEGPKDKKVDVCSGRVSLGSDRSIISTTDTMFNHIGATGGIKLMNNPLRMKMKQSREKVPRLKLRQDNGELHDCKENEAVRESGKGIASHNNSADNSFNNSHYGCDENESIVKDIRILDRGNRVKSADYRRRSPHKSMLSPCVEASNAAVSPFISITPRRKIELPTSDGCVLPIRAPSGYSPDTPTSVDLSTIGVNGISSVFKGTRRPESERLQSPVRRPQSLRVPSPVIVKPVNTGELSEIYPNIE